MNKLKINLTIFMHIFCVFFMLMLPFNLKVKSEI